MTNIIKIGEGVLTFDGGGVTGVSFDGHKIIEVMHLDEGHTIVIDTEKKFLTISANTVEVKGNVAMIDGEALKIDGGWRSVPRLPFATSSSEIWRSPPAPYSPNTVLL